MLQSALLLSTTTAAISASVADQLVPTTTIQATVTTTTTAGAAVSATVLVEVSNNNVDWFSKATIALSGTTSDSDGYCLSEPWPYYRVNASAVGALCALTVTHSI